MKIEEGKGKLCEIDAYEMKKISYPFVVRNLMIAIVCNRLDITYVVWAICRLLSISSECIDNWLSGY